MARTRNRSPENQDLREYQEKISQRLEYIRSKRRSLANTIAAPDDDLFKNMIGAAVSYHDALKQDQR